jgi:hypothetical protein
MKTNRLLLLASAFALLLFSTLLSSCKKEETPPAKPKLSFKEATRTVKESDGEIEVKIKLDKGAFENVKVNYTLSGTAIDKVAAGKDQNGSQNPYDYEIIGTYLSTEIAKGDSIGIIKIRLISDLDLEDAEKIIISVTTTDSNNIEITRSDDTEITVNQEDGLIILLEWPAPTTDKGQADMDLLLRVGPNTSAWEGILSGSAETSFTGPEGIFIPKVVNFAAYGLSYVYYDGTIDPLEFTATFIDFVNGVAEPANQRQSFKPAPSYTAVNKNKWTNETISSTKVVQTFLKTTSGFSTPSTIAVPTSGSRIESTTENLPILSTQVGNRSKKLNPLFLKLK